MSRARLVNAAKKVKAEQVNLADAYTFLAKLTWEDDPVVTLQTYDDQKKGRVIPQHFSGTLTECQSTLKAENRKGAGIFVMVNAGDLNGRSEENVTAVRAVFLDLDGSPLEPVLEWGVKPHLITQTSPGPDEKPRYQCFWLVKDFPVDKKLFGAAQTALCEKFKGDPHITKDLNRVMRVPGFYHNKRDPFLCELVDRTTSHPPYSAHEIFAALGVDPGEPKNADVTELSEIKENQSTVLDGSRNAYLTSQAGKLRNIGLEFEEFLPTLTAINSRRCKPPLPDREVQSIARSVSKYPPGKTPKESKAVMPLGISFAELLAKELPPPRWIINGLLPEGLTILAGAPKAGKSWFAQNIALAKAQGSKALGHYPCDPGTVLHAALEDNPRRFQHRLKPMCKGKAPDNAFYYDRWPRLNDGGLDLLHRKLIDSPDIRLVIFDTLAKVRPTRIKTSNSYQADYEDLSPLQQLAGQYEIAIVMIHHTTKAKAENVMDEISGTRGISGCADSWFVLQRESMENLDAVLYFEGRDLEKGSISLTFDKDCRLWLYGGNADDVKLSRERREIRNILREAGEALTPTKIAERSGKGITAVHNLLTKMVEAGEVIKQGHGKYALPPDDDTYGEPWRQARDTDPAQGEIPLRQM